MDEKYPEHKKLQAIPLAERNAIGDFLEWISERDWQICKYNAETYEMEPVRIGGIEGVLALFYGIDRQKLSDEKDQMYRAMKEAQDL